MKYDELYPDAPEGTQSDSFNHLPPVVKTPKCEDPDCKSDHKCFVCNSECRWLNTTASKKVCSQECNSKIWDRMIIGLIVQQLATGP